MLKDNLINIKYMIGSRNDQRFSKLIFISDLQLGAKQRYKSIYIFNVAFCRAGNFQPIRAF